MYECYNAYDQLQHQCQVSVISNPNLVGDPISSAFFSEDNLHLYSNHQRNFVAKFDRKLLLIKETIGQGEYGEFGPAL